VFERVLAPAVDRSVLTAVHPERYVASIERACAAGGGLLDADTVVSERSFEAALRAAGGSVRMVEPLLDGEASAAFSSHRPPGHRALPSQAMGFCLFNNIAIAARYALDARHLERVMIIDWDVHHGNSINQVFHASNQVLFVSIHQSPLFPGTGPASDVGEGDGIGFTVNCRCLRDPEMRSGCRSSSTSSYRSRARSSHSSCSSPRDTTRIATICSRIAP
jgi:acetoin utilization deacetylase AcuC-like enzyme